MLAKRDKFAGEYYCGPYEPPGESEGSGSSGRIDAEIIASEDSSSPKRKCMGLKFDKHNTFGVSMQVLSLSKMSPSERKGLVRRLRHELEQIRMVQKKVELQRANGVTVSSSSDILSCSNGQVLPRARDFQKLSMMASGLRKKGNPPSGKARRIDRTISGKSESAKHASAANTSNIMLMKQCEDLLKRLMGHQYGWVFNQPVDVVKLNLPDYFNVIKHPMDLGTVKKKIASGIYASPLEFHDDVKLTFSNAMTYNPPGNDVHIMADTLNKFFEVRWKNIEKKLPVIGTQLVQSKAPSEDIETSKQMPPAKKRKTTSVSQEIIKEPVKRMTDEEKHNLGTQLESLLSEMPTHITDFLREHSSNGNDPGEEDEIEIDIDDLSDAALFTLKRLLDDHLLEKQKTQVRGEPCEIELMNESAPSNSSMQQGKGNDQADEDVDIGGNEPPVSSYPPMEIEKDACNRSTKSVSSSSSRDSDSGSSDSESGGAKASSLVDAVKVPEAVESGAQFVEKTSIYNLHKNQRMGGLDQLEQTSQPKPSSVESDGCQDGDSAPPTERQISPEKLYRAALLKKRFADTIIKAREKALTQSDNGDPEKLHREREELEQRRKKEKARLQAEAEAAEDARRQAEAEAAEQARRKREVEREEARQALLKIEKTIEINENSRFLEDLEMLSAAPVENLPSLVDGAGSDPSLDPLGSFKFGSSNPLEQLGLYMKEDEEDEEVEPPSVPNPINDAEEGEID